MTFLSSVAPVLSKLPPLCLENCSLSPSPLSPSLSPSLSPPSLKILDSLRSFLFTMASSPPPSPLPTSPLPPTTSKSFAIFKSQNQLAVTGLVALSGVRGSASDLLLLISVLLGVGVSLHPPPHPPEPSPRQLTLLTDSGDDDSVEQQQQHFPPPRGSDIDDFSDFYECLDDPSTATTPKRGDKVTGGRDRERGEEWRATPVTTPDDGEGGVMDKATRIKMEAKKRMRIKKGTEKTGQGEEGGGTMGEEGKDEVPNGVDVPLTEEERRKIKQQNMPKKVRGGRERGETITPSNNIMYSP